MSFRASKIQNTTGTGNPYLAPDTRYGGHGFQLPNQYVGRPQGWYAPGNSQSGWGNPRQLAQTLQQPAAPAAPTPAPAPAPVPQAAPVPAPTITPTPTVTPPPVPARTGFKYPALQQWASAHPDFPTIGLGGWNSSW